MWISKKKLAEEKNAEFMKAVRSNEELHQWETITELKQSLKKLKKDVEAINVQIAKLRIYLEG